MVLTTLSFQMLAESGDIGDVCPIPDRIKSVRVWLEALLCYNVDGQVTANPPVIGKDGKWDATIL